MKSIAIIPARGGSKRIPRKNIRLFAGKPIIGWSIEAALESGIFDDVIVSTDDDEIAQISRQYGAQTPFTRPSLISDDMSSSNDVVVHALNYFLEIGKNYQYACCIYPTAPFIQATDIKEAYIEISNSKWDFVFPITKFSAPIFRSFQIDHKGSIEMFFPEFYNERSQDLPYAYYDAGQFYWGSAVAWKNRLNIFSRNSKGIEIPWWRSIDIDTEEDWTRAELISATRNNRK